MRAKSFRQPLVKGPWTGYLEKRRRKQMYKFKLKPFQHQYDALKKSWNIKEYALFCEMGTGKSKILIDTIGMLYQTKKISGAIVVAPKGVFKNWQLKEIPDHLPDEIAEQTDVILWSGATTKKNLANLEEAFRKDDRLKILVINVEAFSSEKATVFAQNFLKSRPCLMAVDESTTIKNMKAKRTKNIVKVGKSAGYRRILTGSPITKSPMDLYTQCAFLTPNLLGFPSFYAFQNRYAKIIRRTMGAHSFNHVVGYQNLEELSSRLDGFSFRVLKKDCLDLPEKIYTRRLVELTDEQKHLYKQIRDNAVALLGKGEMVTAQNILTQILRLQQICSGFLKSDTGEINHLSENKMSELTEVLEEVDGKVIIWCVFREDLVRITKHLNDLYGAGSAETYFGDTSSEDRQAMVTNFQNPNHRLRFFVGQSRTGGYGLTLTEATCVIYYTNSFDLEVRMQSEDRAHRIGQKNNVTYVDLVTENTVEEKILKALRDKINIATEVLSEDYKDWLI